MFDFSVPGVLLDTRQGLSSHWIEGERERRQGQTDGEMDGGWMGAISEGTVSKQEDSQVLS